MRVLVDSNVLVSFVTGRNAAQLRSADRLFGAARDGKVRLLLHQQVLSEIAFVLTQFYERPASEVREMLASLLGSGFVAPVDALDWSRLLDLWPAALPHFGDACLASSVEAVGADSIATFDRVFARWLRKLGIATYWS